MLGFSEKVMRNQRAIVQWVFILMPSRFASTALLKMKPTNCQ